MSENKQAEQGTEQGQTDSRETVASLIFHQWIGDRVILSDEFEHSLKEPLTAQKPDDWLKLATKKAPKTTP
jgi:hypothetical protein